MDTNELIMRLGYRHHGLVTRRVLTEAGVPDWAVDYRLEKGLLVPIEPGVFRIGGAPTSDLQQTLGAVLGVGGPAAASHQTAVWLWKIWDRRPSPTHVSARAARWRRKSYVVHRSSDFYPEYVSDVQGIPTTTMERTVVDLGATAGLGVVAQVLDAALRRELVTLEGVDLVIQDLARPGRSGIRAARLLVEERKRWLAATESELEDLFVRLVRRAGLPEPEEQFEIRDGIGVLIGRVDFYYPAQRIAIELDGFAYHSDRATFDSDRSRQNRLVMEGITLLRYTIRDLRKRPDVVIAELNRTLVRAGRNMSG